MIFIIYKYPALTVFFIPLLYSPYPHSYPYSFPFLPLLPPNSLFFQNQTVIIFPLIFCFEYPIFLQIVPTFCFNGRQRGWGWFTKFYVHSDLPLLTLPTCTFVKIGPSVMPELAYIHSHVNLNIRSFQCVLVK